MSETTEVKGQFGLDQSGGTGKKLKILFFTEMTSKLLTPALYSDNGLENQWLNVVWGTHDLICGCNSAIKHLAGILQRKGDQLCLPSTTEDAGTQTTDKDGEQDAFEEGDLDALFSENFEEDDG